MLEIIFRGKRVEDDEWEYGSLIYPVSGEKSDRVYIGDFWTAKRVDPATVCQYTGLTDKNGVKIFEADIVRQTGANGAVRIGTVEFERGAFSVRWRDERYGLDFAGFVPDIEVVGNIHENLPEGGNHA